jgi:L-fucose isomerase-like protein
MIRIGVLPLARPTFDVPYAQAMAARAFAALERSGYDIVGGRDLLFDAAATQGALAALAGQTLDLLLVLQVTFTDATMTVTIANEAKAPLAIWAFPEPRAGGRLRLNAFCGLNLALHALGRAGHPARWLYAAPDAPSLPDDLEALVMGAERDPVYPAGPAPDVFAAHKAKEALEKVAGRRIGLIGEHPAGFDTCRYDAAWLASTMNVAVAPIGLPDLFSTAQAVPAESVDATRNEIGRNLKGLDEVDRGQLDKSVALLHALERLKERGNVDAFAVRCWPEMFTEYGCAICGPMGMMTQAGTPCACEADVYGALTALLMQEVAGAPAWLVDIVDMDPASDTGVFWHCGSAPLEMADPADTPRAQIHSNRRMPLLQEFTLKPGRVTIARISQARNEVRLVLAGGEMERAPMSFTGTSGVVRFDRPVDEVTAAMLEMGLEHHVAIVYGEHRAPLRAVAERLGLPVTELT